MTGRFTVGEITENKQNFIKTGLFSLAQPGHTHSPLNLFQIQPISRDILIK